MREERRRLERIRAGDREAAEALVEESYAAIFASLVRLCGDRDLAADLTQESYRKAWQALASFDGRSRFSTWLYRIAYNAFVNRVRRPLRAVSLEDAGVPILADPAAAGGAGARSPRRPRAAPSRPSKFHEARELRSALVPRRPGARSPPREGWSKVIPSEARHLLFRGRDSSSLRSSE